MANRVVQSSGLTSLVTFPAANLLAQIVKRVVQASGWQILDSTSIEATADTPIAGLGVADGYFKIAIGNTPTHQAMLLTGAGMGTTLSVGLSPIDLSGDLPGLPKLPGGNSPIFLGPRGIPITDGDPLRLFQGWAIIIGLSFGDGVEAGVSLLVFVDVFDPTITDVIATDIGGPFIGMLASAKAAAFLWGLDYLTNAAAGGGALAYRVTASQMACTI